MAEYTKLLEAEIQALAGRYELRVASYAPIEQGAGNTNYLLQTNRGKFILTVFEIEPRRVAQMSNVLLLLEQYQFPAPRLYRLPNGEVLTAYKEKSVLVKPYITGRVETENDAGQVKQVGTALARLHAIPAPDYLSDQHTYVEKIYPQVMALDMDPEYQDWIEQRYKFIIDQLPPQLPVGLVHGDLFYDNVLFEDGKFKAILDFEDMRRIYKVFDLGMAVAGICTEGPNLVISKVSALVAGYQEVLILEEIEKDSLQMCIEWAAILTSAWGFWKYNIDMPDADKSEKYMQMVNIPKSARAIPIEDFKAAVFSGVKRATQPRVNPDLLRS